MLAVDQDETALRIARDQMDLHVQEIVDLRAGDLREVAARAASSGAGFDLIWGSDVIWPAAFEDPAGVVAELADALSEDGTLALFTTNYYASMFLPGHSRLERLIRTASEFTWGLPVDGSTHHERLGAWMRAAGLVDIAVSSFPITAGPGLTGPARSYMVEIVWPEMRHAVASHGRRAGMDEADVRRAEELLDPGSPTWVGSDPDAFVLQPALLWTGRRCSRASRSRT